MPACVSEGVEPYGPCGSKAAVWSSQHETTVHRCPSLPALHYMKRTLPLNLVHNKRLFLSGSNLSLILSLDTVTVLMRQ
jgi:hypothetical protein